MWFISTILELRIWTKDLSFSGEEPTMKDLVSDGNRLPLASFVPDFTSGTKQSFVIQANKITIIGTI
jgi:hypothetical protein